MAYVSELILLAVEMGRYLLFAEGRDVVEGLLRDGEHSAGADGAVVEEVGTGLDLVGDGLKHQLGHEFDGVAWCPVFAGFLVVFLVETTYEVLEDGAHGVVVQFGQFDRAVVVLGPGKG